jgi:hypothetical protein
MYRGGASVKADIPWGPIRSLLFSFSFGKIKEIIGYTGIDMTRMSHLEQKSQDDATNATKSQLLSAIDQQVKEADATRVTKIAAICCEEMLRRRQDLRDELDHVLSRVGWKFAQGNLVPVELFDSSELQQLPPESHKDLIKAAVRLRDGDLSGALSSACSAVDSATNSIYLMHSLGEPGDASFQEKVKKSLEASKVTSKLEGELGLLSWDAEKIKIFRNNLMGALNQAANVMQVLRSNMGDVHGTKPVLAALVYDSLKWSALLLRLLSKD